MKYNFFLTIILFNFCNVLKAQPYIPLLTSNQKWEQFQGNAISICTWYQGQLITIDGDTIIQAINYKKVIANPIASLDPSGFFCSPYVSNDSISNIEAIMREDTALKKVFIYDTISNTEKLIYDFSLAIGDTLKNYFCNLASVFTVDSVRLVNYNILGFRKTFYIHSPGSAGSKHHYIEGIGCTYGFTKPVYQLIGEPTKLFCVRDSSNNPIYGSCLSGFVGLNDLSNDNLKFEYSAFENSFELKSDLGAFNYKVEFYNSSGQLIQQYSGLKTNSKYPIEEKMEGLVLYRVFVLNSKVLVSGKVIAGN